MKINTYQKIVNFRLILIAILVVIFSMTFTPVSAYGNITSQSGGGVMVNQEVTGATALLSQQITSTLRAIIESLTLQLEALQSSGTSGSGVSSGVSTPGVIQPPSGVSTSGVLHSLRDDGNGTITATITGSSCGRTWRIFWGDQSVTRVTEPGVSSPGGACPRDLVYMTVTHTYTQNGRARVRVRESGDNMVRGEGIIRVSTATTPNVPSTPPATAATDGILSVVENGNLVTAYITGGVCGKAYWIRWNDGTRTRVAEDDQTANGVCPQASRTYIAHHRYQEPGSYRVALRSSGELLARVPVEVAQPASMVLPGDCRAEEFSEFVGEPLDRGAIEAKWVEVHGTEPGNRSIRYVSPRSPVTADYSPSRLNVQIGQDDIVSNVSCG